jgi:hypothetical protein
MHKTLLKIINTLFLTSCIFTSQTYSMEERNLITQLEEKIENVAHNIAHHLHGHHPAVNIPHLHETAYATYHPGISQGEKTSVTNRTPIVKAALEKFLNRSLTDQQVPKIAFVCSGGGYRAMFCTTGSLAGAAKIGLLDAVTYISALSGSTWAVAPWITTGIPIKKFKTYIKECAAKSFFDLTDHEESLIKNDNNIKIAHHQPRTLVDPYGALLANRLLEILGDQRHLTYLSDQAAKMEQGLYPYAIYTAIDGRESVVTGQTSYEFTAHTIGDRTNNILIPTWSYGNKFDKGQATITAPEKNLAYIMGTCGSAFAANVHEILKNLFKDKELLADLEKITEKISGDRLLPFYAKVLNYMHGMNNLKDTTLSKRELLKFVDAGLELNDPYVPFSGICPERTVELLIFLDASAGEHVGSELKKVANYAAKHNFPFPSIANDNLGKETMSVFKDEHNANVPTVIYMPRISNQALWEQHKSNPEYSGYNLTGFNLDYETNHGFAKTQHFQYTPEHSTLVMNQTEFNMRTSEDEIKKTINWVIDNKKNITT